MRKPITMTRRLGIALGAALVIATGLCVGPAAAHEGHAQQTDAELRRDQAWAKMLANKSPLTVTATFDRRGRLWLAGVTGGHIEVRRSDDGGRSFSGPVRVDATPRHIAAHGDARPQLRVADDGAVLVSWTENLASPAFASHVWLARSDDDGRSFAAPVRINDDERPISHDFVDILAVGSQVWAVWLDRRDRADATAQGRTYKGAALYYAVSADGGRSFGANRKLADNACECCRLAVATAADGVPRVLWRQVFADGSRDHALARLDVAATPAPPQRASEDGWQVDACPHHGPALASAGDQLHFAWFTGAAGKSGLHYRHGDGQALSTPLAIGNPDNKPSNPQVWAVGDRVVLAWKEFDGQRSLVRSMASADAGKTWTPARTLADTADRSDHPLLIARGAQVFLSWNTAREGYRLLDTAGEAQ